MACASRCAATCFRSISLLSGGLSSKARVEPHLRYLSSWSSSRLRSIQPLHRILQRFPERAIRFESARHSSGNAASRWFGNVWQSLPNKPKVVVLAVCIGSAWAYADKYLEDRKIQKRIDELTQFSADDTSKKFVLTGDSVPKHAASRRIPAKTTAFPTSMKIVLYQYQTCPFCCKVRAVLDYFGIGYDVVEVNPVTRKQLKWSTWKKVPQVLISLDVEGTSVQQLNDSSMIISLLYSYLFRARPIEELARGFPYAKLGKSDGSIVEDVVNKYNLMFGVDERETPRTKEELFEERQWRRWVDETLVHVLSPNVYRTPKEALQAFRWFSITGEWERNFSVLERLFVVYVGASAMYLIGKRLKKRHRLSEDVRISLYRECDVWAREVSKKGSPYLGGERPNLADLAVYGVLSAIEGCDAFQDLMANSNIRPWFERTKIAVETREGSNLFGT